MADITINGAEITFDMEAITISEYRKFANGSFTDGEDDELLARVAGMKLEAVQSLSQPNYRRLLKGFFEKARSPLADPN